MAVTKRQVPTFMSDRTAFIQQLVRDLEKPYQRFIKEEQDELIEANRQFTGASTFMEGGEVFATNGVIAQLGKLRLHNIDRLDPSLQERFTAFQEHRREHEARYRQVAQALQVILATANSWQELRDMLPEHVIRPYLNGWGFKGLNRIRPDLASVEVSIFNMREGKVVEYAAPPWLMDQVERYRAISDQVDLYIGYKLL